MKTHRTRILLQRASAMMVAFLAVEIEPLAFRVYSEEFELKDKYVTLYQK